MISLKYLQMKPVEVSEEVVRNFRKNLEEATEYELKKCDERNRDAYQRAKYIVLN